MSYFDLPRLHISGRFFADPSSVNNDPVHYLRETTRPAPWQMPKGQHFFRFHNCRIMSALEVGGAKSRDPAVVGATMRTTDTPTPAKIVDIDVYQQAVSSLYGVEIRIANGSNNALTGKMDPPVLNGNSFNFVQPTRGWDMQYGWGSFGGDSNAIGVFQSVIRVAEDDWGLPDTGIAAALKERCVTETTGGITYFLLAFKFLLDGYWNVPGSTDFQNGRMTGAIGPLNQDDPHETPGARWLQARAKPEGAAWYVPFFYRAPFRVDRGREVLQVDWSGSVSRVTVGGDPCPLGDVTAVVAMPSGPEKLGSLTIDAVGYTNDAAIAELQLSAEQAGKLSAHPLELWTSREDIGPQCLFFEAADGLACCTQNRAIRMTAEQRDGFNPLTASVHVTEFGRPKAGIQPRLKIVPVHGTTPGATVPPSNPGDTWQAEGALTGTVGQTDGNGFATVTFTAVRDPGSRTTELDGQMYFAYLYLDNDEPWTEPRQEAQISVLVWSRYDVIKQPEWSDVQKLMAPYAKLYPGMTEKFDLSDKEAFIFYSNNPDASFFKGPGGKFDIPGHPEIQDGSIPFYISLPIGDPRYMPVSRDLSPGKVGTLLNFISDEQEKYRHDGTPEKPGSDDDPWLAASGEKT